MNEYRQFGPLDDAPHMLGDIMFSRLDMQADPATLPPGSVQVSQNYRFSASGAQPRAGLARMLPAGITLGQIRWAGIYRPAESNDRIALVLQDRLVLFNPADQSTSASYPFGVETVLSTDPVDVVQAGISATTVPDLYILRGLNKTVLKFNGSAVAVSATFRQGLFALFYQDRMAVATGDTSLTRSQEVTCSDYLDFTVWNLLNQFKISKGGDDYLIGFMPYQKDYVLVATRKRFFVAYFAPAVGGNGYAGGLVPLDSFLRELTRANGLLGRRAWLEANGKIWFLSDRAIFAFDPQLDLQLTVAAQPISHPIQPVLDRLSANYAQGADAKSIGYRLYFAMPISDAALNITSLVIAPALTATATTSAAHDLQVGDTVQLTSTLTAELNGIKVVTGVPTTTTFTYATVSAAGAAVGDKASAQKIATRNNVVAVFNTSLGAEGEWESVDTLPRGLYADWLLVCDYGAQRRLWLVDRDLGPFLYEQGVVDEFGAVAGGVTIPSTLPFLLSSSSFGSSPVAAKVVSREFQWGQIARHVKAGGALMNLAAGDQGTMTLTALTPRNVNWIATRDFDGTTASNVLARKKCGKRALAAYVQVVSTFGRPILRGVEVEVVNAGRTAED